MAERRFAEPFLAMVESLGMSARLQRGRRDARAGHVRHLSISSSLVVAQVRGPDEPTTRRARIAVRAFGATEWARVDDELAAEAGYVADLLAGRLPAGLSDVLARLGLSLLPQGIGEVAMDCTCPEPVTPCVHLAAACHALADALDADPFAALAWRGRGRDELLLRLRELRGATGPPSATAPAAGLGDLAGFFSAGAPTLAAAASGFAGSLHRPDTVLDEAEPPPLTLADRPLTEWLRSAYRAFAGRPGGS